MSNLWKKRTVSFLAVAALTVGLWGGALAAEAEEAEQTAGPSLETVEAISFAELGDRILKNNFTALALGENIDSIEGLDYDKLTKDVRDSLNNLNQMRWLMIRLGQDSSYTAQALEAQYNSLRDTFEALQDGSLQEDNAGVVHQLKNAQNQLVIAGETLYIALVELEQTDASLDRSLAAMDRTVQEMELRHELGQISDLTLQEVKSGRVSMASGQQTLEMNIEVMKLQLETLLGAQPTGTIQLSALPQVSDEALEAMDLEADLAASREVSYSLYEAEKALKDARETYEEAEDEYTLYQKNHEYSWVQIQHTWQAAQYTYQASVQSFETSFRTLYVQVKNYKQVLEAAKVALKLEEAKYAAAQLQYEQGNISLNTLLSAQDSVASAQDTVSGAALDLFSAYHNYRWAVDYGILN